MAPTGSVEISGSTLLTVERKISPSASVPMAKYAPRSRKAATPIRSANAVATAAPASMASTIGVPLIQSVRATSAPSPKNAACPRLIWPA